MKVLKRGGLSLFLVLTLIFSLFAAGCGNTSKSTGNNQGTDAQKQKSEEIVTIKFTETLTSPDRTEYVKSLISEFEKENPNIKVELISLPWEQAHNKLITQIAANQLPDVVEITDNWLPEFAATGKIENLEKYFDGWENKEELNESTMELAKVYKNTIYSIPYGLFIRGLFYREDWLKDNNLSVPETYDELFEISEKLTDADNNKYGYSFRGGKGCWTQLINTIMTQAGKNNYFDENGKCILREPAAIKAFEQYCDLYRKAAPKDSLNWGYNEKVNAFTSGITGFLSQDSEVIGSCEKSMEEGTWNTAPLLKGPDGKRHVVAGFIGYAMSSNSKHKEESWKFIEYMMSKKVNSDWNKKTNTMPVLKSSFNDEHYSKGYIKAWADTAADSNTVFFNHPKYLPQWPAFYEKESVVEFQKYLLGKQTAEETMNKWADYLEEAYAKYNQN
jgi:multiple sugar transport system substrate-binding protein